MLLRPGARQFFKKFVEDVRTVRSKVTSISRRRRGTVRSARNWRSDGSTDCRRNRIAPPNAHSSATCGHYPSSNSPRPQLRRRRQASSRPFFPNPTNVAPGFSDVVYVGYVVCVVYIASGKWRKHRDWSDRNESTEVAEISSAGRPGMGCLALTLPSLNIVAKSAPQQKHLKLYTEQPPKPMRQPTEAVGCLRNSCERSRPPPATPKPEHRPEPSESAGPTWSIPIRGEAAGNAVGCLVLEPPTAKNERKAKRKKGASKRPKAGSLGNQWERSRVQGYPNAGRFHRRPAR